MKLLIIKKKKKKERHINHIAISMRGKNDAYLLYYPFNVKLLIIKGAQSCLFNLFFKLLGILLSHKKTLIFS